ncbi:MAG: TetR/AcrR family transcriptional regulator [endosymbiont of Galathealinum brachiosum]|uniref:TetR/AcrR family transcriptional regulator n=1 Tax=endosymbiont of Galathealinum brachiosum TaxID=2200906 RepID=A0A370DLX0_9GAMM|nr:MAG: TetR/AcrR family transcriptional regulator [endosymbiont of Galathealinum brachiosum]
MVKDKDTKQLILDTAATLFYMQSYTAVGVAKICKEAGVSKGSFFHFFGSKQDLAVAVLDQFSNHLGATLISESIAANLPPMERLDSFINMLYEMQKSFVTDTGHLPGCPFGNMAMEQATLDEVIRKKVEQCLIDLAEPFRRVVTDAVKNGEMPEVNEEATADAMLSYIEGIQLIAKSRNDAEVIRILGPAIKSIRVPV